MKSTIQRFLGVAPDDKTGFQGGLPPWRGRYPNTPESLALANDEPWDDDMYDRAQARRAKRRSVVGLGIGKSPSMISPRTRDIARYSKTWLISYFNGLVQGKIYRKP